MDISLPLGPPQQLVLCCRIHRFPLTFEMSGPKTWWFRNTLAYNYQEIRLKALRFESRIEPKLLVSFLLQKYLIKARSVEDLSPIVFNNRPIG